MAPEEIDMAKFLRAIADFVVAYDPGYNNLSKLGLMLLYDHKSNFVALTKIDKNTMEIIVDDETRTFEIDAVKDQQTFLTYVNSLDSYCKKYNCDYNTAIAMCDCVISDTEKDISIKSPTNPNQKIVYDKASQQIKFLENHESETIVYATLDSSMHKDLINEDNFVDFAEESFRFCKETGCSFADYANEIALKVIQLKSEINELSKTANPGKKLLYTFFDEDGKTAFTYYEDKTIYAFNEITNGHAFLRKVVELEEPRNSAGEFFAFIKINKTFFNQKVNEYVKEYKYEVQQELEKLTGANGAFKGHVRKR